MENGNRNPRVSYSIRIIAGLYVVYLGITAIRSVFIGESSLNLALAVTLGGLLALVGAGLAVTGIRGYLYLKKHPEEFEEQEEEAEEEEAAEVPEKAAGSLLAKASMPEYLQVSDEDEEEELTEEVSETADTDADTDSDSENS